VVKSQIQPTRKEADLRLIGSTVSHYRLLGPLGAGGSAIYQAEDVDVHRPVLLHFLTVERGGDAAVERFCNLALAAAALSHPNISPVHEIGAAGAVGDRRLFAVLAPCDGETLADTLARGPLAPLDAVDLGIQVAAGLGRAHAAGIVHGDLRPDCVLLTPLGEVRIAVFGRGEIAAPPADAGEGCHQPPERRRSDPPPPTPAGDVWALGVLLYALIAGRPPFAGETAEERAAALRGALPAPLPDPHGRLPRGLERAVVRALGRRPEDRYGWIGDFEAELRRFAAAGNALAPTRLEMPQLFGAAGAMTAGGTGEGAGGASGGVAGMAGRKLPAYRIYERLGSGGMAVVYRAEDTRLERIVALKFLAPELSRDPAAKERFLAEARAASALDHPNLCTVHDYGETDDGQIFLAMPYYGGETLARRIERGPLPLDAALDVALQVARGLAKAHRHGIVHRDVKPANLMLTDDGVVKILDFGLAMLAGSTGQRTPGAGTLAYISPEQAGGGEVDPRTDLWSLGVVLYEMLAGEKPFRGGHEQAVLYAILSDEPAPLAARRPEVPPALAALVARLLAKAPDDRYASADELAADLRVLRGPESADSRPTAVPPAARRRRRLLGSLGGLAAAALLALAVRLGVAAGPPRLWLLGPQPPGPVPTEYVALTDQPGRETFPSLSPAGDFFVYVKEDGGDLDIFWQRLGGGNPVNLTADSPVDDTQPAISPDGAQIAFRSERDGGGLFVMGATGESVRRLTDAGYNPAWSPDGRRIAFATEGVDGPGMRATVSEVWWVDVATGARRRLAAGDAVEPSWSPDGRRIAYWGVPAGSGRRALWTVEAAGGAAAPVPVVDDKAMSWSPAWSPDGEYLYFASDRGGSMGLWRVPIDAGSGRVRGAPQSVPAPAASSALPSFGRDPHRLLFASQDVRANLMRAPFDPLRLTAAGPLTPVTQGSRPVRTAEVSPDGRWIVYDTAAPQEDLFLVRADGGQARPLTDDRFKDRLPRWSADGRRILFYSDRGGKYDAWAVRPEDGALEQLTAVPRDAVFDPVASADGRRLFFSLGFRGPFEVDLGQPLAARVPRPFATGEGRAQFVVTSWSADGRRLAGFDEAGRIVLCAAAAVPGTPGHCATLPEHGNRVTWLHRGGALLFLRDGALFALDGPGAAARPALAPPPHARFTGFSLAPDDRALYLVEASDEGDIGMLTLK